MCLDAFRLNQEVFQPFGGAASPGGTPTFTGEPVGFESRAAEGSPTARERGIVLRQPTKFGRAMQFLAPILRGAAAGLANRQPVRGGAGFGTGVSQGLAGGLEDAERQEILGGVQQQREIQNALALAEQRRRQAEFERRQQQPIFQPGTPVEAESSAGEPALLQRNPQTGILEQVQGFRPRQKEEKGIGSPIFRSVPGGEEEQGFQLLPSGEARPIFTEEQQPFRLGPAPITGDLVRPRTETVRRPFTLPRADVKPKPQVTTTRDASGVERPVLIDTNPQSPTFGKVIGEPSVERKPKPDKGGVLSDANKLRIKRLEREREQVEKRATRRGRFSPSKEQERRLGEIENQIQAIEDSALGTGGGRSRPSPNGRSNKLDANTARIILEEAGGDKEKARKIARERGFEF